MNNTLNQRIEYLIKKINSLSHPPQEIIPISEAEEKISRYEDGGLIRIDVQDNITGTWELQDLSDYHSHETATIDVISNGKSAGLTRVVEKLKIPRSTLATFIPMESTERLKQIASLISELRAICPLYIGFNITPTQIDPIIRIEDPVIPILADFKRMCNRRLQEMLAAMQYKEHPKSNQETIEDTITGIYRNWENKGGFRDAIAKVKGAGHDDIKCNLIGDLRTDQRNPTEHGGYTPTIDDVADFVSKVQELTPEDIIITNTKPTSTRT